MTTQRPDRGLQIFRNWMRLCMRSKNLAGSSPGVIQREFGLCAEMFREQRRNVANNINLDEECRKMAEQFVNENMRGA